MSARRLRAVLTLFCLLPIAAHAGELARRVMLAPLSPSGKDRLTLPMPPTVDTTRPVWVVYRMYAVSASESPSGDIVMDGSFDGVPTPADQSFAVFSADRMRKAPSGGTIGQQFEAAHGKHTDAELVALWGQGIFDAYTALNRKSGAVFEGTIQKTLPPIGDASLPLLVSVRRDSDLHPLAVEVVVGQGDIPTELQPPLASRPVFQLGRMLAPLLLVAAGFWLFRRLRSD